MNIYTCNTIFGLCLSFVIYNQGNLDKFHGWAAAGGCLAWVTSSIIHQLALALLLGSYSTCELIGFHSFISFSCLTCSIFAPQIYKILQKEANRLATAPGCVPSPGQAGHTLLRGRGQIVCLVTTKLVQTHFIQHHNTQPWDGTFKPEF